MLRLALLAVLLAPPTRACEMALVLSLDVSGSIDAGDYRLQVRGLAQALTDPAVAEALGRDQVALAVVQWSGPGQQALVLDWQRRLTPSAVTAFAGRAGAMPRGFKGSDTAVGQGLNFALAQFAAVPDCRRRVIDISGDGPENAGFTDAEARAMAQSQGVTVDAIGIEEPGPATPVTNDDRSWVIPPGGFVVMARGLGDDAATLRPKLLRDLADPIG